MANRPTSHVHDFSKGHHSWWESARKHYNVFHDCYDDDAHDYTHTTHTTHVDHYDDDVDDHVVMSTQHS